MPKVSVYTQTGKTIGELQLSDAIFNVKLDRALVHEVVLAQQANARQAIASTKTRGEVRGGGIKPWKQKGTGRARQGSIRSPQWIGGGITFGPSSERNFSVKINKKAKRKALFMALSDKLMHHDCLVVETVATDEPKTKILAKMYKELPLKRSTLMISPGSNSRLMRMVKNMPNVKLVTANSLNVLDVLQYQSILFLKDAVPVFEKLYI